MKSSLKSSLTPPVNLLFLITDLKYGGAQTVLLYLLDYLDLEKYHPQVACLYGGDLPVAAALRAKGICVTDLKMSHSWRLDALWRLYRLLRREQVTILHASLFHASLAGRLVGRLARVPVILTWRQNVSLGGRWREVINKWTSKLDDFVVAVSEPARQAELKNAGFPKEKIELIYNCIDIDLYTQTEPGEWEAMRESFGIPPNTFLIGFVGRLHLQKGIDTLLEAFSQFAGDHTEARLLIVGDGELRSRLEIMAGSLGISGQVKFVGVRRNIPEILASLDLFVLPSRWEGLPLALLEAMAACLPVVATAVGGTPEVVIDGETGLLVPPGDPDALAQAIVFLIENPELRKKMGQAGRKRVAEHFTIQETVRKTEALYQKLLVEKGILY